MQKEIKNRNRERESYLDLPLQPTWRPKWPAQPTTASFPVAFLLAPVGRGRVPAARRHAPATSSLPGCPLFPLDVSRDATLPPSPWGSLPLLLVLSRARSEPWPKPPQAHRRRSHSHPIPLDRSLCLRDPPHRPLRPHRATLHRESCIILTTIIFNLGRPRLKTTVVRMMHGSRRSMARRGRRGGCGGSRRHNERSRGMGWLCERRQ